MKIKLEYLFSYRNLIGSKLISWASNKETPLKNCPSHVALLVNEKWVFESTMSHNVSVISYKKWKEKNIESYKLLCSQDRTFEEIKNVLKPIKGKKYDVKGILYFALMFLRLIILKKPLPLINKWQDPNKYFCCEAVGTITGSNYSMFTPAKVYLSLKQQLKP
jgi:hypothetical protein